MGAANAATAQIADTEIEVTEDVAKAFLFDAGVSLSDLVMPSMPLEPHLQT